MKVVTLVLMPEIYGPMLIASLFAYYQAFCFAGDGKVLTAENMGHTTASWNQVYNIWRKLFIRIAIHLNGICLVGAGLEVQFVTFMPSCFLALIFWGNHLSCVTNYSGAAGKRCTDNIEQYAQS